MKLEHVSDWHSYYKIGDKRVTDGMVVVITWPNKFRSHHTVKVRHGEHRGHGGMDESYSWETLEINVTHHNTVVPVVLDPRLPLDFEVVDA
jgi:hypothetical protein